MHTVVLSINHLKLVRDSWVIVRTDSFNIAGRHVALAHTARSVKGDGEETRPEGGGARRGGECQALLGRIRQEIRVTRPDVENNQRKSMHFIRRMTFLTTVKNIIG